MTLFEICKEISDFFANNVDHDTGDLLDVEKLENLQLSRKEKILNCAKYIRNLEADILAVASEKKRFADWELSLNKKLDAIKKYLSNFLKEDEKIEDAQIRVSYRKPVERLEIVDISKIPDKYLRLVVEPEKLAIKNQLKLGNKIDGVALVLGEPSVVIR